MINKYELEVDTPTISDRPIFDEPTAALDMAIARAVSQILPILIRYKRLGTRSDKTKEIILKNLREGLFGG